MEHRRQQVQSIDWKRSEGGNEGDPQQLRTP
jgi:hypothetical protein